jgi:GH25 family lysozyme M1 (1,4-beta-N-acetylmuramidase)
VKEKNMSYIQGVDVSAYQPSIDWQKLRNQDIRFAIIKSTEGLDYFSKEFDKQWAGAKSAGILRGSYHYLRAAMDGAQQADHFLSKVKVQDGDLPPVVDIEEKFNEQASSSQWIENTQKWLERVEAKTGRRPIVYSTFYFLRDKLGPLPWAKNHPTWVAQYLNSNSDRGQPMQPEGWGEWIFWQYSQSLTLDGNYDEAGNLVPIDRNVYRHSLEELYKLAKAGIPVDGTAAKIEYIVKAGDTLNSIAIENGTTQKAIATLNNLAKATDIRVGMVLKLPYAAQTQSTSSVVQKTYTVKAGDTLNSIAIENGTTQKAIATLNNLAKATDIRVGMVLKLS